MYTLDSLKVILNAWLYCLIPEGTALKREAFHQDN